MIRHERKGSLYCAIEEDGRADSVLVWGGKVRSEDRHIPARLFPTDRDPEVYVGTFFKRCTVTDEPSYCDGSGFALTNYTNDEDMYALAERLIPEIPVAEVPS